MIFNPNVSGSGESVTNIGIAQSFMDGRGLQIPNISQRKWAVFVDSNIELALLSGQYLPLIFSGTGNDANVLVCSEDYDGNKQVQSFSIDSLFSLMNTGENTIIMPTTNVDFSKTYYYVIFD